MVETNTTAIAEHYSRMQVETASHSKAVWMLHDKCVRLIAQALAAQIDRRQFLNRAQNILAQLEAVLRIDDRVAESIFLLYDYCYILLERGGDEDCENAGHVLRHLADTFWLLLRKM